MSQDILELISQYCQIHTTEDEAQFLSELLSMARYIRQKTTEGDAVKLQFITRQFIWQVSEEIRVNLNGDYDFFENLSAHLESVFSAASPVYPDNPIIEEVLQENREVAAAIRKKLSILEQYTGVKIDEIELGYIEARYIESMIANIEENGPYVVLSPGFAVPHEAVEQGSLRVGMSLIRLTSWSDEIIGRIPFQNIANNYSFFTYFPVL